MNKVLGLCSALDMDLTLADLQVLLMTSSRRRVFLFALSAFEDFASLSSLIFCFSFMVLLEMSNSGTEPFQQFLLQEFFRGHLLK